MMKTITIRDHDATGLTFDLRDILALLGADALTSTWTINGVECFGELASQLHEISDSHATISGQRLFELTSPDLQIADGEFAARLSNETRHWIVIRAIDSSAFDIETDRIHILDKIRSSFKQVEDVPTGG